VRIVRQARVFMIISWELEGASFVSSRCIAAEVALSGRPIHLLNMRK